MSDVAESRKTSLISTWRRKQQYYKWKTECQRKNALRYVIAPILYFNSEKEANEEENEDEGQDEKETPPKQKRGLQAKNKKEPAAKSQKQSKAQPKKKPKQEIKKTVKKLAIDWDEEQGKHPIEYFPSILFVLHSLRRWSIDFGTLQASLIFGDVAHYWRRHLFSATLLIFVLKHHRFHFFIRHVRTPCWSCSKIHGGLHHWEVQVRGCLFEFFYHCQASHNGNN